jgi:hypothetical protein
MGCCGQRRTVLRGAVGRLRLPAPAPSPATAPEPRSETVRLVYITNAALRVRGTDTGRTYEFSAAHSTQVVHRRDADALLRTGLFRIAQSPSER